MSDQPYRFRARARHLAAPLHGWSAPAPLRPASLLVLPLLVLPLLVLRRLALPRLALPLLALPLLAGCARQAADAVSGAPDTPGFLLGVWHGFIFPVAWVFSLFDPSVAVYAVPNNGGWYDFGFFVGVVFLGVGANRTRTVTQTVYVDRWGPRP